MLICNERNFLLCDPECPHIGPHEAVQRGWGAHCDDYYAPHCAYRDDGPVVRCVEAQCPATA